MNCESAVCAKTEKALTLAPCRVLRTFNFILTAKKPNDYYFIRILAAAPQAFKDFLFEVLIWS